MMLKLRHAVVVALTAVAVPVCAQAAVSSPAEQAALRQAAPDKKGIRRVLVVRGLDKMTGHASTFFAPIGRPVQYATLTVTARYCFSTPALERPETTAFLQIEDTRPGEQSKQVFSGWMFASAPEINAMQHPLYDVWILGCKTNEPGQETLPVTAANHPVKPKSPDAGPNQLPELPEGSGQ